VAACPWTKSTRTPKAQDSQHPMQLRARHAHRRHHVAGGTTEREEVVLVVLVVLVLVVLVVLLLPAGPPVAASPSTRAWNLTRWPTTAPSPHPPRMLRIRTEQHPWQDNVETGVVAVAVAVAGVALVVYRDA